MYYDDEEEDVGDDAESLAESGGSAGGDSASSLFAARPGGLAAKALVAADALKLMNPVTSALLVLRAFAVPVAR